MATRRVEAGSAGTQVRIGMLGTGFMGRCHSHAFRTIPLMYDRAGIVPRLLILCGRDERKLARSAARFGFEEYTTDWQDIVNDPRVEVFDNCGPDPVHVEPSIAALAAGKHVICEKPMALSLADAARMRDAARSARGKAFCVFNYRFFPAVRFARDLIEEGRLGRIHQVRVRYLQMAGHDPSLRPDEVWCSAWPHSGALQGIGSHAIDQCRFLVGEIRAVSAVVKVFNPDRAVPTDGGDGALSDECTAATIEFTGGAVGVLESSTVCTGRKNGLAWEINGSAGSLAWDLERPNTLRAAFAGGDRKMLGFTEISVTDPDHPHMAEWWPPGHTLGWEHAHTIEKFHFLRAMLEEGPPGPGLPTFEDGYRVMQIVGAMRESVRSGRRVEV